MRRGNCGCIYLVAKTFSQGFTDMDEPSLTSSWQIVIEVPQAAPHGYKGNYV